MGQPQPDREGGFRVSNIERKRCYMPRPKSRFLMNTPPDQGNAEDDGLAATSARLRLFQNKTATRSQDGRTLPQPRYENFTGQGSSRIHAGNSYIENQHHHYAPAVPPAIALLVGMSLVDALAFPEMGLRSANVATALSETCDWLFTTPEYKRWQDPLFRPKHHGVLWIKGKPGAGKSTIMKHALRQAQQGGDIKSIFFFYNARGVGLEKTTEGMYRALLCQAIEDESELQKMVGLKAMESYQKTGWPVELLKDMFRETMLVQLCKGGLTCYVDALDECHEDQVSYMLVSFEDLGSEATSAGLSFWVCLASRLYPKITIDHCEEIVLDHLTEHQDDISKFVHRRLKLQHTGLRHELAGEIRHRSSGVFLWVVLVVVILNKTSDCGNIHLLRAQLQAIPTDLYDVFGEILDRDGTNKNLVPMIQWTLFSKRALAPKELYFAVMASTGQLETTMTMWAKGLVSKRVVSDFLLSSSKGFLEIMGERLDDGRTGPTVGFIHESVPSTF